MPKKEQQSEGRKLAFNALTGAIIAITASLLLIALLAIPISSGKLDEESKTELIIAASFAGAFAGALFAVKKTGAMSVPVSALTGILEVILRVMAALVSGRGFQDGGDVRISVCIMLGAMAAGLVGKRRKKRRRA